MMAGVKRLLSILWAHIRCEAYCMWYFISYQKMVCYDDKNKTCLIAAVSGSVWKYFVDKNKDGFKVVKVFYYDNR